MYYARQRYMSAHGKWWGEFEVPQGRSLRWQVGPLLLTVTRLTHEWRVFRSHSANANDDRLELAVPCEMPAASADTLVTRYVTASSSERLKLTPVLPDRAVISRPERPIRVLPRQNVTIYLGSPLWLRLEEAPSTLLDELPAITPLNTWWGPNTMEGEHCYAARTYGRLRLSEANFLPHRVSTAVEVENAGSDVLVIERINLPVRKLSIYAAETGRLWTESIHLERASTEAFAALHIGKAPAAFAGAAVALAPPRERHEEHEHALFRAFGSLFG